MGLREWWDRVTGSGAAKQKAEEEGLSEPSEAAYDTYEADKADRAADQRDPGIIGMGQGDDRGGF